MSRLTIVLLCFVLLSQAIIHGTVASESVSSTEVSNRERRMTQQQQQQHQQQQQQQQRRQQVALYRADTSGAGTDIDLTELTPSLEQQLYQAKRLNRADSADWSNLVLADDALRYDMLPEAASQDKTVSLGAGDAARNWLDRVQTMNNLKRRTGNGNFFAPSARFSRGLNHYNNGKELAGSDPFASPILNEDQNKEDKDYAFVSLPASVSSASSSSPSPSSTAIIDNHESASRDSLWTSKVLRDLLIAQEARTRAKNLDQLARIIARQRGANFGRAGGDDGEPENREKRRRCKVDPNLGVKNPSFCDTDAYFGAQDYTVRDVWDLAGR